MGFVLPGTISKLFSADASIFFVPFAQMLVVLLEKAGTYLVKLLGFIIHIEKN